MRAWLLAGGMLAGGALAVLYIARVPEVAPPVADVAVWVDDRPISRESYERALAAVAADRKDGRLRDQDRERVLDRLIDQELLISRAIELGLHERDPQIRNLLATSMIDFLVQRAEDDTRTVDDSELRAFYERERFRFEKNPEFRIAVRGNSLPVPDGFLIEKEIAQRLGPTVATRVTELQVGDQVEVSTSDGDVVVTLVERRGGGIASFEDARDAVEAAYRRAEGERAVRDFLEEARQRSDIRVEPNR